MTDAAAPSKEEMDALREAGKTRQQIADHFGVTLSAVKRWIASLGVVDRKSRRQPKEVTRPREKPRYQPLDDGESLMDKAKAVLGKRMGEDHRGYILDGRPCSSWQIVNAAGLELKPRKPPSDAQDG